MSLSIGLDIGAKAPISSKKVYYVLRLYTASQYFNPALAGYGKYSASLEKAARFSSVTDVLTEIQKELARSIAADQGRGYTPCTTLSTDFSIIRVEETPGSEQRVVLGETQEAPKGATVKYAIFGEGARAFLTTGHYPSWTGYDAQNARLFESQSDAIEHIVDEDLGGRISVKRVAVTAGTPTLTETVLS